MLKLSSRHVVQLENTDNSKCLYLFKVVCTAFCRVTARRAAICLALQLIVRSDCFIYLCRFTFSTLLIDAFPVYLSHSLGIFSESLHSRRHGLQPERDLQLLLYAGQWLALWRIVLQDIAVYCDAEYLRLGIHPNGHLNRQVSLLMQPYPLSISACPRCRHTLTTQEIADVRGSFAKVCGATWFGCSAPLSICEPRKQLNLISYEISYNVHMYGMWVARVLMG